MQTKNFAQVGPIIGLFVLLATLYSLIVPVFEAPDESAHYLYADYVARNIGLPRLDYAHPGDEYHQPPLYYWLTALSVRAAGLPNPDPFLQPNPMAAISDTAGTGNKNAYRHNFAAEAWPWRGTVLALRLGRFMSIGLGGLTVWLAYLIGLRVFGGRWGLALAATALVAFNPQFIFISASMNNDNLVTLLVTLSLWLALRLNQSQRLSWRHGLWAGVVVGLAILAKPTGVIAGVGLSWVFLGRAVRLRSGRPLLGLMALATLTILLSGWWVYRNHLLYQDPLLRRYLLAYLGQTEVLWPTLRQFLGRLQEAEISFWATFGWLNIVIPEPFYLAYRWLIRLGLIGVGVGTARSIWGRGISWLPVARQMLLPLLTLLALLLVIWQWVALAGGIQGRLLFPAIVPLALLIVWGWSVLAGETGSWIGGGYTLAVAIYALIFVIKPAYAPPPVLAQLPAEAIPTTIHFQEGLTLAGYTPPTDPLTPGQPFSLTLYWVAEQPVTQPYAPFIHAVDALGVIIAQSQGYAGRGLLPADQWPVEGYVMDQVSVELPGLTYAPTIGRLLVGVYEPESGRRLALLDGGERAELSPFVVAARPGPYTVNQQAAFERGISLLGYDLPHRSLTPDTTLELTLHWQTEQPLSENYAVFVHVLDAAGIRLAQDDSWPAGGAAPTKLWIPGQPVADTHTIKIPRQAAPGVYEVWIGLYHAKTGERVSLLANEALFGLDALRLTQVLVEGP